ncbi:MAG: hypothetical protein ABJF10_03340 [Chthoniobacter sp.]|uniref:hypothetical protein n=1 Tax=Chthoniobacter sp. TaxID=2510640 RepID=UPI0032A60F14
MPDHFATLAQPRRPWLDDEVLKEAFHRATAQQHPDVAGGSGEQASALNAAYAVLRDPAARLRHLLDLEWPEAAPSAHSIAPEFADLFQKIAARRQGSAALAKKMATAQSPVARALLAGEQGEQRRALESVLTETDAAAASALEDLRALDVHWTYRDTHTRHAVAALQQRFAFLAKWQAHLREVLFQIDS